VEPREEEEEAEEEEEEEEEDGGDWSASRFGRDKPAVSIG
jgi:hypothetical protein